MSESKLCGFNILINESGNLITEQSTVHEKDIDNLSMNVNDRETIKAVLRSFKRKSSELHAEIEKELQSVLTLH